MSCELNWTEPRFLSVVVALIKRNNDLPDNVLRFSGIFLVVRLSESPPLARDSPQGRFKFRFKFFVRLHRIENSM
jgi:hypothetical protein